MASQMTVDQDAFTAPFMLTKAMHRDVYPAVDPVNNPAIQVEGKVVVVRGATGGLGFAIVQSYLSAKAKGVVIVGRNLAKLQYVIAELNGASNILPVAAESLSQDEVDGVFKQTIEKFGRVDVLVNAAGSMSVGPIGTLPSTDWWSNFEVTVHGVYNMCHGFVNATGGKGTIINLVSLAAYVPNPGMSGYSTSVLAVIKLGEFLDLELPDLRVFSVHPGIVEAANGRGWVDESLLPFSKDKAALAGGLAVYLTHDRADFLRGGYIHANWDVEEMERHKEEIVQKKLIKLGFLNVQLQPGGYPWSF